MLDLRAVQEALAVKGLYKGEIDGISGKQTKRAIDDLLAAHPDSKASYENWSDARRLIAAEQIVIEDLGIEVGKIDGLVGEQTRYGRDVYAARKRGDTSVETWRDNEPAVFTPPKKAMAWPKQAEMEKFYGKPGTGHQTLQLPFPMRIAWEPAQTVNRITVHSKCHDAIARIFKNTLSHYGYDELKRLRLDMFGGCYNNRNVRGGSQKSTHAYACAIDLDPDRNQLKWGRDKATFDDEPYKKFWEYVYAEGAISLGIERNYDWMHWQFARL